MVYQCFLYVNKYMLLKQFTIKFIYFYISAFPLHSWDEKANIHGFK